MRALSAARASRRRHSNASVMGCAPPSTRRAVRPVSLRDLHLFEEARSLLRKVIPTAQRVLGEDHYLTLLLKKKCAQSLYRDDGATLDDLREAVTTLEDTERIARRVLSGAHPLTTSLEDDLQDARAARDALQK